MKTAKIITTGTMSSATYDYICSSLCKKFSQEFAFRHVVDDSIVGGFIVKIDNEVFDQSLKTKLEQCRHYLSI